MSFAAGLLFACGCSTESPSQATGFLPDWNEARKALESALTSWRDSPDRLTAVSSQGIQFVDQQRRPAQKLRSFEILSKTETENARQFIVRLRLEDEPQPRLVRYNVFGRSPIWVYRLEDYENISHWMHKMDDDQPESERPGGEKSSAQGADEKLRPGSSAGEPGALKPK